MNSRRAASRTMRRTSRRSASLFIVVFMNGAAGVESPQCALARVCGVDYDREWWRLGRRWHRPAIRGFRAAQITPPAISEVDNHYTVNLVRELCSLSRALALDSPHISALGIQVEPSLGLKGDSRCAESPGRCCSSLLLSPDCLERSSIRAGPTSRSGVPL